MQRGRHNGDVTVASQFAIGGGANESALPRALVTITPSKYLAPAEGLAGGQRLCQRPVGSLPGVVGSLLVEVPAQKATRHAAQHDADAQIAVVCIRKPLADLALVRP